MIPGLDHQLAHIGPGGHLCLFYEKEPAEQLPTLLPFIRDGLAQNEPFLLLAGDASAARLAALLQTDGINVAAEKVSGRLKFLTEKPVQLRDLAAQAAQDGFHGVRVAVEMNWFLGSEINPEAIEQWEATLGTLSDSAFPVRVVCQYDCSRLEPRALLAGLRLHPHAIAGETVYPNFYHGGPLILAGGRPAGTKETGSRGKGSWMLNQLEAARQSESAIAGQLSGMTRLHILSNRLASTRDFDSTMQAILESIVELHGVDRGLLLLYDEQKGALVPSAQVNFSEADIKTLSALNPDEQVCRNAYTERRRIIVPEVEGGAFSAGYKEFARKAGFKAVHTTPVLNRAGLPLGVLTVYFPYSCRPTPQQIQFTDMHARQAADFIERYRAEEELRGSKEHLRAIVENAPECIKIVSPEGNLLEMNPAGCRILGAAHVWDVLGKSVYDLIAPEDRARYKAAHERVCAGSAESIAFQIIDLNGSRHFMECQAVPLRDPQTGKFNQLATTRDVTAQKVTQTARQLLAAIVESSDDAIITKDLTGTITSWNKGAEQLFGYAARETIGRSITLLIPPERLQEETEILAKISRGEPITHFETKRLRKDGSLLDISLTISPVKNADGKIIGASKIARDITEQKRAENELRNAREHLARANKELEERVEERTAALREVVAQMEEFSYSVSHDLRAPVRAMKGYAAAALEDFGPQLGDRGREYLNRILSGSTRMENLIHDVLTYSRVARAEMKLQPVSLQKLVQDIIQHYPAMQSPQADIAIREPLHSVLAHESSLMQAISNLMSNGIKFVVPGTTPALEIWTELRGDKVRLSINDNGIGIKPEYQHRLFGMFERLHQDSKFEGTGIGLAIVRKAMDKMGGHAGVESDGVNGSCFWIELPAAEQP